MRKKIAYRLFVHLLLHTIVIGLLKFFGCSWWAAFAPTLTVFAVSVSVFVVQLVRHGKH